MYRSITHKAAILRQASLLLACLWPFGLAAEEDSAPMPGGKSISQWVAALEEKSVETRVRALGRLSGYTGQARFALPKIARLAEDKERSVSFAAMHLLGEFGPDALDWLPILKKRAHLGKLDRVHALQLAETMLAITRGTDKEVVRYALALNGPTDAYHTHAARIARPLVELVSDNDPLIRARAAGTLGAFALSPPKEPRTSYLGQAGEAGSKIAPALDAALSDQVSAVRAAAAVSLAAIKPESADRFVPVLLALLEAQQIPRREAGRALRPFAAQAAAPLLEMLVDPKDEFRFPAAEILAELEPDAQPVLVRALTHKNPQIRMGAAYALGRMGKSAAPPLLSLAGALRDEHEGVRLEAAEALTAIDPASAPRTLPVLIEVLSKSKPEYRQRAAIGLGLLGGVSKDAIHVLTKALLADSYLVRLSAAQALVDIDPAAAGPAVPVLLEIGFDRRFGYPEEAATDLGRIGPAAKDAMPKLRESLRSPKTGVVANAAIAMVRIEPSSAPEAVAVLTSGVTDAKSRLEQTTMLRALGRLGKDAGTAVPELTRLLTRQGPVLYVRSEVAAALLRIDPENAVAVDYLHQLREEDVQGRAAVATSHGVAFDPAEYHLPMMGDQTSEQRRRTIKRIDRRKG